MSPRVSVIVPAYRAERYLTQCLESLAAQTLREMEILVVDDGSDDGTGEIAREWTRRDSRIRVLSQPENRGVSAARNLGLEQCRGAYVGFCDADDRAEPQMYETLYQAALDAGADVSCCGVVKERRGGEEPVPLPYPDGTVLDRAGIRLDLIPQMISLPQDGEALPISGYTPRNLFRRGLLEGIRFREEIHYAEDLLFIVQALLGAERVAVAGGLLYRYRFHGASATKKYMPGLRDSYDACHQALMEQFRKQGMEQALAPRMEIRRRRAILSLVANDCARETPYGFPARIRQARKLLADPGTRQLFQSVALEKLAPKLRVKYACVKYRLSLPLVLFYSLAYRAI